MMKLAIATLLAGSAAAFAPATGRSSTSVALSAEKSASLPFLNRPALVSWGCRRSSATSCVDLLLCHRKRERLDALSLRPFYAWYSIILSLSLS